MMKFATNASKLHRKVGETLAQTAPFKEHTLSQEVAVSSLFPAYPNNRDRYDWVVPSLKVVIECHGIQHYKFQTFGEEAEIALMKWRDGLERDQKKKNIALEHGWSYIEIPYTDEKQINSTYLLHKFSENFNEDELKETKQEEADWKQKARVKQLDRAKKARQDNYKYLKKLKEQFKNE